MYSLFSECKKGVIFMNEYNKFMTENTIPILYGIIIGLVVGFIIAPIKNGFSLGCNNGNNNQCTK